MRKLIIQDKQPEPSALRRSVLSLLKQMNKNQAKSETAVGVLGPRLSLLRTSLFHCFFSQIQGRWEVIVSLWLPVLILPYSPPNNLFCLLPYSLQPWIPRILSIGNSKEKGKVESNNFADSNMLCLWVSPFGIPKPVKPCPCWPTHRHLEPVGFFLLFFGWTSSELKEVGKLFVYNCFPSHFVCLFASNPPSSTQGKGNALEKEEPGWDGSASLLLAMAMPRLSWPWSKWSLTHIHI